MKRIIITTVFLTLYSMLCGQVADTFKFKEGDYKRIKPVGTFTIPKDTLVKLNRGDWFEIKQATVSDGLVSIPPTISCTVVNRSFDINNRDSKDRLQFTNGNLVWSFVDSNYNLVAYRVNEGRLIILDSMGMINVLMAELDKLKYFIKNN